MHCGQSAVDGSTVATTLIGMFYQQVRRAVGNNQNLVFFSYSLDSAVLTACTVKETRELAKLTPKLLFS